MRSSDPGILLAKALSRDKPSSASTDLRQGVVLSSTYTVTPPMVGPQVNVLVGGAATPIPCYFFDHCFPQVGETVWVQRQGADMFVVGRISPDPGRWVTLTLLNGWVAILAGIEVPAYRVCPDGDVQLRGTMKHATTTTTGDIFTLPAPLVTDDRQLLGDVPANTGLARIDIGTSGSGIFTLAAYISGGAANSVSLNPIRFRPDYV